MSKRRIVGIILAFLALCTLLFIFANSMSDSTESNSLSDPIIIKAAEAVKEGGSESASLMQYVKHVVRKLAHFGEYTIFGILCYLAVYCLSEKRETFILSVSFIGLVTAVTDELIQYYTPGRESRVTDVIVDFAGITSGILLTRFAVFIYERKKCKKALKK